jgi:hypothetical protein
MKESDFENYFKELLRLDYNLTFNKFNKILLNLSRKNALNFLGYVELRFQETEINEHMLNYEIERVKAGLYIDWSAAPYKAESLIKIKNSIPKKIKYYQGIIDEKPTNQFKLKKDKVLNPKSIQTFYPIHKNGEKIIKMMFNLLIEEKVISPKTELEEFKKIFNKTPIEKSPKVIWLFSQILLAYFITTLINKNIIMGDNYASMIMNGELFITSEGTAFKSLAESNNNRLNRKQGVRNIGIIDTIITKLPL